MLLVSHNDSNVVRRVVDPCPNSLPLLEVGFVMCSEELAEQGENENGVFALQEIQGNYNVTDVWQGVVQMFSVDNRERVDSLEADP